MNLAAQLKLSSRLERNPLMKQLQALEKATGEKIDWTHPEKWIKAAQDHQHMELEDICTRLAEHSIWHSAASQFGPNWRTQMSNIDRTFGPGTFSTSSLLMNRKQFSEAISSRQNQVLKNLDKLQQKQEQLSSFRKSWARLGTDARMKILRRYELPPTQNSDIYAYLERSDDVDDRAFGAAERLPIYDERFSEMTAHETPRSKAVSPNTLLWHLEGQVQIYRFLGSFADEMYDAAEDEAVTAIQGDDHDVEGSPLTALPFRSRSSRTVSINLEVLRDVIRTSLDEARDSLWQVRQEAASWTSGIKRMAKGSGSKELLIMLFSRIDIFDTLDQLIGTTLAKAKSPLLTDADEDAAKSFAASLDSALFAAFEERLAHFRWIKPPPVGSLTETGHQLLGLTMENDPVLRLMGFSEVIATIHREVKKDRSFPLAVSQILSDLHVLTVCFRETESHRSLISDWVEHSQMVSSFHVEQTGRSRPWREILEKAVDAMEEAGEYNAARRHRDFWQRLDRHMAEVSQNNETLVGVFREIEQKMPLGPEQPMPETTTEPFVSVFDEAPRAAITATQLRKARQQQPRPQTDSPDQPTKQSRQRPSRGSLPTHLPHIELQNSVMYNSRTQLVMKTLRC
ncbi:hypothetical protein COL154_013551 [Colletotrichum chrysophilum]|nr:hypothetical protein KNSL1_013339 [Colletotrichum chrysophilum]KAJ0349599.1 hypothetical protein COL154_013551 [Colletotrichum chrysophilum]